MRCHDSLSPSVKISCGMSIKSGTENIIIMFHFHEGIINLHYELDRPFSALHYV